VTKILRILNRLNVGGPTYNVANLSKYLSNQYQTEVMAGYKEPDEASSEYLLQDLDIPYQIVPNMQRAISPVNDYKAYQFIKEKINNYQPTIVHTHAAKAGALGRMAAQFAQHKPKAIVHTYHGNVFDGYFSPGKTKIILGIERWLATKSDAIVSISETQKKDLVDLYKIAPAEKIHVIPLGFDLSKFTQNNEQKRKQFREAYQINDDNVVISITGRLAPVKNHRLFIEAIALLKQKTTVPFIVFVVGDGELMQEMQEFGVQKGLTINTNALMPNAAISDLVFTSWRKDIDVINAGSDIVALSSLNEGTPVSIIEAMASGKAVVCTKVGGVADIIQHGENGLLSSLDVADFTEQLYLLVENKSKREQLAANASKDVLQKFSYTRLVNDMEKLYEKLLNK
jgi:glycosyltransferase involved in cell wall biosynthesis